MESVYAALLLHTAGQKIDEASLKKVLQAAGATVEEARVQALVAALSEVNIDEAIKTAPMLTVAATPATTSPATPEKKEEKKGEKKEEEAIQGLGSLFQ